jgi:hypothetical protein
MRLQDGSMSRGWGWGSAGFRKKGRVRYRFLRGSPTPDLIDARSEGPSSMIDSIYSIQQGKQNLSKIDIILM